MSGTDTGNSRDDTKDSSRVARDSKYASNSKDYQQHAANIEDVSNSKDVFNIKKRLIK
jgi:hypothetical protein